MPGTFTYTPAAGAIFGAGNNQTLSVAFTPNDTTDYTTATATATINVLPATPTISWTNPANIVYGTALSATQLDATASVPGTFTYTPAAGTVLRRQQPDPVGRFHSQRHDRLHHCHRNRDDQRLASDADDLLGQSGEHRLRHGPERDPARRHGQRGGDVHLHAGRGDGPARRQQPDPVGRIHSQRHDRLHHCHRNRDDQRLASDADDLLGQSGEHRLRHGPERNAARRHGRRGGDVHLHAGRGNGPGHRQQPEPVGRLHSHRHDRLRHCHRNRDDQRLASDADDLLGQSGEHRLRHGPERDPARRHGQRGGDVHLHAGRGDGPAPATTRACRSPSLPPTRPTTPLLPQPRRSTSCQRRRRSPGPIRRTSSTARP